VQLLGLNTNSAGSRPASGFPERADTYLCDKCQRDITSHLHRGRAHVTIPIGPSRFRCVCGETYRSGALEWDEMGRGEKQSYMVAFRLGAMFSIPFLAVPAFAYMSFKLHSLLLLVAAIVAMLVTVAPAILGGLAFLDVLQIAGSLWRTRIARPARKKHS